MKDLLRRCIVFDIETLAKVKEYISLPNGLGKTWEKKYELYYSNEYDTPQLAWEEKAALSPEYSRIISIGIGIYQEDDFKTKRFDITSFEELTDEVEKANIEKFFLTCKKLHLQNDYNFLGGHNIKTFDIPFICKRALILGISYLDFPPNFQNRDRKPWELKQLLDSKELYDFGGGYLMKNTLEELSILFGIQSSKEGDVDGKEIFNYIYTNNGSFEEVGKYCERDVIATAKVIERLL